MRAATLIIRGLTWMIIAMFFIPSGISAQNFEQLEQTDRFRKEELDQMLAPIALYPDSLIAQILMASTYPLEIVQAERWVEQNKSITGDALADALKEKSWDPSIKSLCHFPDVLFAMSDKLDQTSKLGDAFLSQNDDVMATIQQLRRKAATQGNLNTTKEQKVIHEEDAIRIEPAVRHVVYVPVYDPLYVYGPWWHSAYPPYYWHYPHSVIISGGFITFGPRFFVGIDLFSWSWFDWHRHYIYVDVHKARRFKRDDSTDSAKDIIPAVISGGTTADVSRIRTERKRFQRIENRREKTGMPRVRTERKRIQRTENRRERAYAPGARPERKKLQIHKARNSPFHGLGNGNFERKGRKRWAQNRQRVNTKHQGGNFQR